MNFLTHLYFSSESINNTTGIVIGDTARSNYLSQYNLEILQGIATDMQVRVFSENHPAFIRSMQRINPKHSKYAPFIVNIFYDHLLAKNWNKYSKTSMDDFSEKIYGVILENMTLFPYKIRKFSPEMISKRWLNGISSIEGTHQYIKMLFKTERFTTNLEQCLFELIENYQEYKNDFEEYFSDLSNYMEEESERFNVRKEMYLLSA